MPGRMTPLKKPRNTPRLPLALNPLKSKDVLAVLAERNQAVVPIGAWVEPASPDSSEIPAYTSACVIEEELKEQLRKKQEALKHFQNQVKRRVNQHVRLKKKQQLQRSFEAAEKEGSIAMQSSDPAHLTRKRRTSVFPNNLNAAIGSSWLPPSPEDEENQNELFQQQAQALSQTMKQVCHRLASLKTMGKKKASVFPDDERKSVPTQEKGLSRKPASTRINIEKRDEFPSKAHQSLSASVHYQNFMQHEKLDSGESSSILTVEKWRGNHLSEIKDKPFNRVQKVQFKNPLFDVAEEEELNELHLQNILPEAQDYLPEAQSDLSETQGDLPGIQNVKPDVQAIALEFQAGELETQAGELETQGGELETQGGELETQACEPEAQAGETEAQAGEPKGQAGETEAQAGEPEAQASETEAQAGETKTQGVMFKAQSIERENESIVLEAHDFLPQNQDFLPKDQNFLSKDQDALLRDQDVLPKNQSILPKDQDILPKCQDQDFPPKDQETYFRQPSPALTAERWKKERPTSAQQCLLSMFPSQPSTRNQLDQEEERDEQGKANLKQPAFILLDRREREVFPLDVHQDLLHKCQDQATIRYKKVRFREPYSDTTEEREREDFALAGSRCLPPKLQDQTFIRDQNVFPKQPSSFLREEKVRQELPQENHQCVVLKVQDKTSSREQDVFPKQPSSFLGEERVGQELPQENQYVTPKIQDQASLKEQHRNYGQDSCDMTEKRLRKGLFPEHHEDVLREIQDPGSSRKQNLYLRQQSSFGTAEREQEDLLLDSHHHLPPRHHKEASSRRQVYDTDQSGLNTDFQALLALQSGLDQEEDKKVRQKQYLRYKRLFMDIEREQVKEQQRQKELKKKIEKIKKKKEQKSYAEEQRIPRVTRPEEPYSGENMSEILAQLQLEETKGEKEKQKQREKEILRYVEVLRAQIQEEMQRHNITLPPLCCCGPDFWDAHPDTCANNCIFYKNHRESSTSSRGHPLDLRSLFLRSSLTMGRLRTRTFLQSRQREKTFPWS
ncbi:coiled-coil domain-containing protein 15 isoform X3 [Elephas maximus indicus]|uniref:coiled-coil domain-containing protein 15 isoform X3 n=1 Tax=Elephas maximus indicus TaxID=99487 RepID=UPI0021169B6D|nr:coiled-coil domain-containing protein 15 isoform X3 [Elephas maximus indicus]